MTKRQKLGVQYKPRAHMIARCLEAGKRYTVYSDSGKNYLVYYNYDTQRWWCNCWARSLTCRHIKRVQDIEQRRIRIDTRNYEQRVEANQAQRGNHTP